MLASTVALHIDDLELFADCTRTQLHKIGALTTGLNIPRDHELIREGNLGREFIVIRNGSARVTRETNDGVTRVADVGAGDFLGEMALLNGTRRTATVTATTDLDVLVSSVAEFRSILEIAPSVARKIRRASLARMSSMAIAA
jgi:CRP/FNR family cyclic AMP-dependent transcriptional regulator